MSRPSAQTIFAESFFRVNAQLFAPFLAEAGLDERILHTPDVEIPAANYVELWEILGRKVDASIGLRIGIQTVSTALGAYGQTIRSAPTMLLALRCMSHFAVVFAHAIRVDFEIDGGQVILSYQCTDPTITRRRQDSEFTIGFFLSLLREITENPRLTPQRADFEHERPTDWSLHRDVLACPLHFKQTDNRLYFPIELLEMPVRTADPRLFQALEPFLEQQRQIRAPVGDLLAELGRHIASSLSSGGASLEMVAQSMGLGPRTLQRRLAEHQVEFRLLVEDVRRSLAEAYVAKDHYSLTEVALLLGYAECSSFSRAFRRWTQVSPQQYRLQAKANLA
ncbi:AraC family transcriptional regulator [Pseudomonas brassicacearum]|uniref:AraC family transcriptional regulator n=1 Tax=Pseudomonas brassicacearum TaxID=930166 RepID=A0A423JWQ8_9PSED|nr:AraC family transcriptional regulator [Pseudomonas brassicacearum]RON42123.1 AraC family transcriptional regulator [Pseudomonas brassicacearum]